jgi:hypothetical protein
MGDIHDGSEKESVMSAVTKPIPPEFFDHARRIAAEERAKAMAAFFTALGRKLESLLAPKPAPHDVHFRFHRGGLWRGI